MSNNTEINANFVDIKDSGNFTYGYYSGGVGCRNFIHLLSNL